MNNSNNSRSGGNTNTPLSNKTTNSRLRKACFTLCNWTVDEYNSITQQFNICNYKYIIGKEIAPTTGTPHLQGYVEFNKQVYFTALKKICNRIKWIIPRGTREQNITYCSKEKDFICNFKLPRKLRVLAKYDNVVWKKWQQDVIDIVKSKPDDRTIHWFWEDVGNIGKSFLAKYLVLKYNAIIADGKKDNVFNQIKNWLDENEDDDPTLVLLDVPRYNMGYLNYGTLEQIKNGLIYSGKYEGGQCVFDNPHIIVFANEPPKRGVLSNDRLKEVYIRSIDDT